MGLYIIQLLLLAILWLMADFGKESGLASGIRKRWKKRMNIFNKVKKENSLVLFDNYFIDAKAYYLRTYGIFPSMHVIHGIDAEEISDRIKKGTYGKVQAVFERNFFNWQTQRNEFSRMHFQLENRMVIQLGSDWLEFLFHAEQQQEASTMLEEFTGLKAPAKDNEYEINIISLNAGELELKSLHIKPVQLDLDLYYNDDFKEVDKVLRERLKKENDKGIVLLHGLPGTGKTTYLRHLIGSLEKKVLFVSPGVASNLMNPEFMDLLIDHPNAVLVIEDAENIIMDRKYNSQSSVSNLLNISDGLLSDWLNVQIICTFNSELNMVDSALLRKGRLIAKYEFGRLEVTKARALSAHLGMEQPIHRPMTLAEITHPQDKEYSMARVEVLGFRRPVMETEMVGQYEN